MIAVEEADVLLLVTDATTGVTTLDEEVARVLLRSGKPTLLAVNKSEAPARTLGLHEFERLGLGEPSPVSALHGSGTGDLLDRVVGLLPARGPEARAESPRSEEGSR